ncbi:unnamed protein product [Lepeophtheirus salmonis]|uniref:(salmon louse) hypothetical protein n=1 Tax=Lepeophtheirus salmonis TaxID=72036 RepID=A0A7R8CFZ7_LEPSM|nr:unnamed protein product [Lepeophtheirus salmonis]CAF2805859.1 unnamed protein product [Lepeophtheirus salmonis]
MTTKLCNAFYVVKEAESTISLENKDSKVIKSVRKKIRRNGESYVITLTKDHHMNINIMQVWSKDNNNDVKRERFIPSNVKVNAKKYLEDSLEAHVKHELTKLYWTSIHDEASSHIVMIKQD